LQEVLSEWHVLGVVYLLLCLACHGSFAVPLLFFHTLLLLMDQKWVLKFVFGASAVSPLKSCIASTYASAVSPLKPYLFISFKPLTMSFLDLTTCISFKPLDPALWT
jgi:hypothetical protein